MREIEALRNLMLSNNVRRAGKWRGKQDVAVPSTSVHLSLLDAGHCQVLEI